MTDPDLETLDQHLPNEPITSLRRIQTVYGALAEATSGDEAGGDPDYALYYTPGKLDEYVTTDPTEDDRYLVTVEVDLTGQETTADDVDLTVEPLTPDLVPVLGFSWFWPGRAIDHSITHRGSKSGSDAETVTTYCVDRLERWTDADDREPAVGGVAESHPDGWIIERLQRLGNDESTKDRIESLVDRRYTSEGKVVATVRLKLDPDDTVEVPEGDVGWFYPGEVGVLNAAMKARKDQKLAEKNTDVPSRGDGTCMVTGDGGEVFGTADDPLNFFTVQHAEKFDELKRENAWREHPVSSDAALLVQSGESLLEVCRTTRNGLGVYTIPYFVEMNHARAATLYEALDDLRGRKRDERTNHPMVEFEKRIEKAGSEADARDLRFYVISLRNDSGDINVIHEVPDASMYWPREVASAHQSVLQDSTAFSHLAGLKLADEWEPISNQTATEDVVNDIVSGRYAWGTMPLTSGNDGAMADDPPEWLTYQLLTGATIPADRLLAGYVSRIEQERLEDEESRFPRKHIKTQFAQFEALARAGLLEAPAKSPELTAVPGTMNDELPPREEVTRNGTVSRLAVREHRLEQFLSDRDSLSENQERRSAFLLGVLIGMVSHHQRTNREMNRTVVDQYPPDRITRERLVEIWPNLQTKCSVYAGDVGWAGDALFPEVRKEIQEAIRYPEGWTIPLREVRFFYALGITYGQEADSQAYEMVQRYDEEEPTPTERQEPA